jgi:hypothetical protein
LAANDFGAGWAVIKAINSPPAARLARLSLNSFMGTSIQSVEMK